MKKISKKVLPRLLSLLFSLTIIIVIIIVLVVAQGRKLSTDGEFIQTSIIRINSIPKDVKAYINNKEVVLNENRIENLDPGILKLKLVKDGYTSWEKDISLEVGVVKDVYAQLYPESIKFEKVTDSNIDRIIYSSDTNFIFYTILDSKNATENGLWKIKLSKGIFEFNTSSKPTQIARFTAEFSKTIKDNYLVKASSDNNKILLSDLKDNIVNVYDANQTNAIATDLSQKIGFNPTSIDWFRNSESLIVTKDNLILEYEISSNQASLIDFNKDSKLIYDYSNSIVYFEKDSNIYKYINKSSSLFNLRSQITTSKNINKIFVAEQNPNILVVDSSDGLTLFDLEKNYSNVISEKGSIVSISPSGKSIIFDKEGSLYSYNLEETTDDTTKYKVSIYPLNIKTTEMDSIYFTSSTKSIIAQLKDVNGEIVLLLMDYDGTNRSQLIKDFKIAGSTQISQSGTDLYAVIEEKDINNVVSKNIYKFSLEVK